MLDECVFVSRISEEEADADASRKKWSDSPMSSIEGVMTRRCEAMGGRWGVSWKKCGPSSRSCSLPFRISSWRWMLEVGTEEVWRGSVERVMY